MSQRSRIPVQGARLPEPGARGSWLFQRSASHYHQGLDIGGLFGGGHPIFTSEESYHQARRDGKLAIKAVVSGTVRISGDVNATTSYGLTVTIESDEKFSISGGEPTKLWFLHGHCAGLAHGIREDAHVPVGQDIAFVGHSGNAGAKNPHLHFEVATAKLPTKPGPAAETTPTRQGIRIDPYQVLEMLGPFPARQTFIVTGETMDLEILDSLHHSVEQSPSGGYFPLGANNIWHGGIHLKAAVRTALVAPFDGEIVAVRLDPTPDPMRQAFGSTNFVLMRHELPARVYEAMRGGLEKTEAPRAEQDPAPGELEDDEDDDVCCGDGEPIDAALLDEEDDDRDGLDADALEADEEDPEDPALPPVVPEEPANPIPQNPERVVYSLLMHVAAQPMTDSLAKAVSWLTRVQVGPGPDGPPAGVEEAEAAGRRHAEDVAEASSHKLRSSVGGDTGAPEDVVWVRRRLTRFEFLPAPEGEPSGTPDAELGAAIEAFQAAHVFGEGSPKIDGVVSRNGATVKKLRKTRRALGLDPTPTGPVTVSPMFVARTEEREDGVAKVISGLNVPVRAGEILWHSGTASGFGEDGTIDPLPQVHWEIFSEHPIFVDGVGGWDSLRDDDDNLTADAPKSLLDLVDKATFTIFPPFVVGADGVISLSELRAFYRGADSTFLRRRQCLFRTEWGLDLQATKDALVKTFANAGSFDIDVAPYQWWFQAGDRLPPHDSDAAITHVWHYNPIELVGAYQAALESLAPPPRQDPRTHGDVEVTVVNNQGGRLGHVKVTLSCPDGTTRTDETRNPDGHGRGGGVVTFFDVPAGTAHLAAHYERKKKKWNIELVPVPVMVAKGEHDPFVLNRISLHADVDGEGPPTGAIAVTVRLFGSVHKVPVEVELRDDEGGVQTATTSSAKVRFETLAFGTYTVRCKDGQSDTKMVVIDRKQARNATLHRLPPPADLRVRVLHDGAFVQGVAVTAATAPRNEPPVTRFGVTDPTGECRLSVHEGPYVVTVDAPKAKPKAVRAVAGMIKDVTFSVRVAPEEPTTGILIVEVDTSSSAPGDQVELCTRAHPDFPVQVAPIRDGLATFLSPPGEYLVRFGDAEAEVEVLEGVTVNAAL